MESMNDMSSEQVVPNKLSDPSECMRAYQEPAEPDTPTSVASSTRYRGLPTWVTEINEHECHPIKPLQSFEKHLEDISSNTFSTKNLIRIWKGAKLHIIGKRKAAATDLDGPHASVNENSKLGHTMAYDDRNE
ncbi:hypothetical protein PG985_008741 [Apiospora marii]|uniref:uncharacterized protein n=1 Tax=Apiospora marii TaxID=335849 RepID=UPI0031306C03